jgi:hypothetical protein
MLRTVPFVPYGTAPAHRKGVPATRADAGARFVTRRSHCG